MSENELEEIKREAWIAGYLNGAISHGDFVDLSLQELKEWIVNREYTEYVAEQVEQEARNRG